MIRFVRKSLPIFVLVGILIAKAFVDFMADVATLDWFDTVVTSSSTSSYWGNETPLFDYIAAWGDANVCRSKLISDGKDSGTASLGTDTCKRAADEFDEIKKDAEARKCFSRSVRFIHHIIRTADLWNRAIKAYFKDSLVVHQVPDGNTNGKFIKKTLKMPFGLRKCSGIERKWQKHQRKKRYKAGAGFAADQSKLQHCTNINAITKSSSARGRDHILSQQQHTDNRDRSRDRSSSHPLRSANYTVQSSQPTSLPAPQISSSQSDQVQSNMPFTSSILQRNR